MSHTPVPWHCQPEEGNSATWEILTRDGEPVADTWPGALGPDAAEANAEYIVRAVNNHEALLRAAKEAYEIIGESDIPYDRENDVIDRLWRAIQKASG